MNSKMAEYENESPAPGNKDEESTIANAGSLIVDPDAEDNSTPVLDTEEQEITDLRKSDVKVSSGKVSARSSVDAGPPVLPARGSIGVIASPEASTTNLVS